MIKLKSLLKENLELALLELDYPLAKDDDLSFSVRRELKRGRVIWMSPDKFLHLAYNLPNNEKQSAYTDLEYRMKNGLPMDFLELWIDFNKKKVTGHEGRHRAIIAKKLGIEKIPVLINYGDTNVSAWTPQHHDVTDKAEFKPEWDKT